MSTIKERAHRFNGTEFDTVHMETSSDIVVHGDSTVSAKLTEHDKKVMYYAVCDTTNSTQIKAITISEITSLTSGLCVRVKFTNAQTYNGQPKLQINSLTATPITYVGSSAAVQYHWAAGEVIDFVYDGTNFVMVGEGLATTSYYGMTKLSSSTSSTSESLAATPKAVKAAYDLANGKAASSHAHGNITSGGAITATAVTPAEGDAIVLVDSSDSSKVAKSSLAIGTGTSKYLREDGTWSTPPNDDTQYTHPSDGANTGTFGSATQVPKITVNSLGHVTGVTTVTVSGVTPASHTHGNIQNGGTLQSSDITVASGDKLVVTDSSDSAKVARTSISFDGSTTSKALTPKGTWESFNNYTHPGYDAADAAAVKVGRDASGHVVLGAALTYSDVGAAASSHNHAGSAITSGTVAAARLGTMTGASSSAAGASGAVVAPAKGDQDKVLRGNATWADMSTMINTLSEGSSAAQGADYIVCQYAGGGTTTTTYHRRSVSNVVNASIVKAALGTGTGTTKFLREDGTWQTPAYYTHPSEGANTGTFGSATQVAKVTVNAKGHVTAVSNVTISGVTPAAHTHGNITNAGAIGSTSGNAVYTGSSGVLTAGSLATSDPTADGTSVTFIDTISQDAKGKITPTKKTVANATTSAAGLMPATDKDKVDTLAGIYSVKGTQTATTGSWTGAINVPVLYDGLTIAYYLPYAGSGNATLNLTLADGTTTTGAVNVYYTAASRMTTHYGAGSVIILTYYSAGSISVAGTATTDNRWLHCEYDSGNTKNTAGSTNSTSKLFLVGAASQAANPQTYSSSKVYETDGALVATSFTGALGGTAKVGTTADYAVYTTTDGKLTSGTLAVSDPTASGNTTSFIDTISQNSIGKITVTKKTIPTASSSTAGIMKLGASGGAATYSHTHASGDISSLDASKLTGTIDIERLPAGALERLVTVASASARLLLTASTVQLGDVVKQSDTGVMYYVVDESKLSTDGSTAGSEDAFEVFTAGAATSVPWSGVTGKPSSYTPASHTHGSLTNDGKVGSTSGYSVYTTTGGAVTAGTLATSDPTASGTSVTFIATASQDSKGKMTLTKKTVSTASSTAPGLVPTPPNDTTKFLRGDATWAVPPGTYSHPTATATTAAAVKVGNDAAGHVVLGAALTYSDVGAAASSHSHAGSAINSGTVGASYLGVMTAASSSAAGAKGAVPAPAKGDQGKFLRGDATWATPAGTYSHPSYTAATAAAVKVGNDATGHVVIGDALTASDVGAAPSSHNHAGSAITSGTVGASYLGVMTAASSSAAGAKGAVPAPAKGDQGKFLRGDATWATPSGVTPASHTHGNITNDGKITASAVTAASGDSLVLIDSSDSSKVIKSGISIGTSTSTYLRNDGSWATPPNTNTTYTVTTGSVGSASGWSAGTKPALTVTSTACDDITAWDAGSAAALTTEDISCDDITAWSAGTAATATVGSGILTINDGTAPSLSYTARTVKSVKTWTANTIPSLSYTARSVGSASGWSAGTLPALTVTSTTVVTAVTADT